MAQQVAISFVDDIDGSEAEGTVTFAIDGRLYNIDLSAANADKLRDIFAPYVSVARRAGRGMQASRSTQARNREESQAIREWAEAQGMSVAARGRIPGTVLEAYRNQDGQSRAPEEPQKKPRRRAKATAAAE